MKIDTQIREVSVRLTPDEMSTLRRAASDEGLTISALIRSLIYKEFPSLPREPIIREPWE